MKTLQSNQNHSSTLDVILQKLGLDDYNDMIEVSGADIFFSSGASICGGCDIRRITEKADRKNHISLCRA